MGKALHGRFHGTAGSSSSSNTLNDNLPKLTKKYPLKDGYFAPRGNGRNFVREMKCKAPVATAKDFYNIATKKHEEETIYDGNVSVATMRDKTEISHRSFSSSDGSPVVEINIKTIGRVKYQKIHFVKETSND